MIFSICRVSSQEQWNLCLPIIICLCCWRQCMILNNWICLREWNCCFVCPIMRKNTWWQIMSVSNKSSIIWSIMLPSLRLTVPLLSDMRKMKIPNIPESLWKIRESAFPKKVSVISSNDSIRWTTLHREPVLDWVSARRLSNVWEERSLWLPK